MPTASERFIGLNGFDLAVVGMIVGIIALVITIVQLTRTRRAVAAMQIGVDRTERHLASNQLLVLIPQLQRIETELDEAVDDDDRKSARRQLASWRTTASEVQGLLTGRDGTAGMLENLLRESAVQAAEAKAKLLDGRVSTNKGTEPARKSIAETCQQASIELGRLKSYSQGEPTDD